MILNVQNILNTPNIFSLFAGRWYTAQVSHVYKRFGSTTTLSTFSLVSSVIPFRSHSFARSLPNATLAFFCNSGSDLNISVHYSGKSASQVVEFINNFQFLSFTVMDHCTVFQVLVGVQPVFFVLIVRS